MSAQQPIKVSRRATLRLLGGGVAAAFLAACAAPGAAPSQPGGESGAAAPGQEEVTLVHWMWTEGNQSHFLSQIDRWNQEQTGQPKLTWELVLVPSSEETVQKGMNAMATGSGVPDVFSIEISTFSTFLKGESPLAEQYLTDITPLLDVFNSNWKDDYLGFAPYTWQGKIYGIELGLAPTGYYYRQDLFDEVGIETPIATWEDYMAAGEQMAAAGHALCAFDTTGAGRFIMDLYQAGGAVFDDNGDVSIEDDRMIKAVELNMEAVKSGAQWATEAFWEPPHYAALNDGKVAGVISGSWYGTHVLKPNVDPASAGLWRVQSTPAWSTSGPWGGPDFLQRRTSTWGGTCLACPQQSANAQLTFEFLAFACLTQEGATSLYQNIGNAPMLKAILKDDSITNFPDDFYGGQAEMKVYADVIEDLPPKYPHPFWNEAEQEIGKINAPAMAGEDSYENLIAQAAERIRTVIASA